MSFSHNSRSLRRGRTYNKNWHPKISVNSEDATNGSELYDAEEIVSSNDRISPELIEWRLSANLEPLNEQILALFSCLANWYKITWRKLPNVGFSYSSLTDWTLAGQKTWSLENFAWPKISRQRVAGIVL